DLIRDSVPRLSILMCRLSCCTKTKLYASVFIITRGPRAFVLDLSDCTSANRRNILAAANGVALAELNRYFRLLHPHLSEEAGSKAVPPTRPPPVLPLLGRWPVSCV